jgi:hypothetical protein
MLWYVCCDESTYPGLDLTGFVKRWESMGGRSLPKARLGVVLTTIFALAQHARDLVQ